MKNVQNIVRRIEMQLRDQSFADSLGKSMDERRFQSSNMLQLTKPKDKRLKQTYDF